MGGRFVANALPGWTEFVGRVPSCAGWSTTSTAHSCFGWAPARRCQGGRGSRTSACPLAAPRRVPRCRRCRAGGPEGCAPARRAALVALRPLRRRHRHPDPGRHRGRARARAVIHTSVEEQALYPLAEENLSDGLSLAAPGRGAPSASRRCSAASPPWIRRRRHSTLTCKPWPPKCATTSSLKRPCSFLPWPRSRPRAPPGAQRTARGSHAHRPHPASPAGPDRVSAQRHAGRVYGGARPRARFHPGTPRGGAAPPTLTATRRAHRNGGRNRHGEPSRPLATHRRGRTSWSD